MDGGMDAEARAVEGLTMVVGVAAAAVEVEVELAQTPRFFQRKAGREDSVCAKPFTDLSHSPTTKAVSIFKMPG